MTFGRRFKWGLLNVWRVVLVIAWQIYANSSGRDFDPQDLDQPVAQIVPATESEGGPMVRRLAPKPV